MDPHQVVARPRGAIHGQRTHRRAPQAAALGLGVVGVGAMLLATLPHPAAEAVTRGVTFAATLVAVGICVFARLAHDRAGGPAEEAALRRAALAAAVVGVAASFAWLAFEVGDISGRGLAGATDASSVRIVMHNGTYAAAAIRSLGLVFLAYAVAVRWGAVTEGPLIAFGALLACGWSMLTGHPASHGPSGLVHAMTFLHVAAASVWSGGLVALAIVMRHRRREDDLPGGAAIVKAFSRLMTWTLAALLTGGTVIAWAFLRHLGALTATRYGLVLVAKIGLVATLLAVGAFNHRRLVPAVAAGDSHGWRTLGGTVAFEQLALVAVLGLTAVLVNLDPHA